MRSLYDDIFDTLTDHTFSIPNVTVRKPYDESPKHYPLIVVHEITNLPKSHATVSGEERTVLAYQLDILTKDYSDGAVSDPLVLSKWEAGKVLVSEVSDLLDTEYKLTRRTITTSPSGIDTTSNVWRGECTLDSYGYSYRR